jgi:CheY-like chemotaxis protein
MAGQFGQVVDRIVASFRGLRILVIGGAGSGRALVARYLRSIVTCDILELTAADTLGFAAQQADLAIVDIDSSGPEAFEAMRVLKARAQTPVIAMAASQEEREIARQSGADETLPAQPSFNDLQAAVIRALARPVRVT